MTNNSPKDSFIKNPFDAPRSKYRALYKSLKAINDKNEAAFINKLVGMIISKKLKDHLTHSSFESSTVNDVYNSSMRMKTIDNFYHNGNSIKSFETQMTEEKSISQDMDFLFACSLR